MWYPVSTRTSITICEKCSAGYSLDKLISPSDCYKDTQPSCHLPNCESCLSTDDICPTTNCANGYENINGFCFELMGSDIPCSYSTFSKEECPYSCYKDY